jgi:flavin-dependent dehydrogenase
MSTQYDAIVVGARCAGSPTAMLLARKGYRVLAVDRATFPSDTISTHLVGDAGYNKDFITAQGIQDAFRDAELCAAALDESFTGARSFDAAMADYQSTRDQHVLALYEFTAQLASQEPPPPEMQQLLGAVHGNQQAMNGFARVSAGVTSPAEFFSEENVKRIFAAAR